MSNYDGDFSLGTNNNPWNKAFTFIAEKSTVLDVGCSAGSFGQALIEKLQCVVDGIEPDKADADIAATKLRKVAQSYMEEALTKDFKDEKYDFIVFLDVIEHLYNPVAALKAAAEHLKPNGSIIFSIPNMAHASVRIMLLGGDFEYGNTGLLDNTHLHYYTKKEINRVFNEANFKIREWGYIEAVYTKQVLKAELAKVGIKNPSEELLGVLRTDNAKVFQYVGVAQLATTPVVERPHYSPDPQGAITSWYEQHDKEVEEEFSRLDAVYRGSEEQVRELNNMLQDEEALMKRISLRKHIKHVARTRIKGFKK